MAADSACVAEWWMAEALPAESDAFWVAVGVVVSMPLSGLASRRTDVMSFQKAPGGTRGARTPPSNAVTRALTRVMMSWHRRSGDKFQGMDLLYLTTVGAKTGQKRQATVARFPDGEDAWLVV